MTTVFQNGRVYTMNREMPCVSAVAVRDDRIIYVGNDEGAGPYKSGAKVIDLAGKMLIPGLIDAHCHPLMGAFLTSGILCGAGMTHGEVLETIRAYVEAHPGNEAYFGQGYPEWVFDERGPRKEELDAICPDKPLYLMSNGIHEGWCNSRTLELGHITGDTPDPMPGFSWFHRDENGEPTGVLYDAAGSDVKMKTQVRIAANIANGIKHAFKEFQASEILIGMHMHAEVSNKFWGEFHQSLFNGLNNQIIMARLHQPLTTIRRIQVAVPSRAQYEPGFYRWLERLARMASNLECRIVFHSRTDTLDLIREFVQNRHHELRAEYEHMEHWNEMPRLATTISQDHMFVVVTARKGTVSYKNALDRLPDEITRFFSGKNLMIIFPDQFGEQMEAMTFAQPQHTEERSAYDELREWIEKKLR